eukprot:758777-Hanusia_phi.AAC.3
MAGLYCQLHIQPVRHDGKSQWNIFIISNSLQSPSSSHLSSTSIPDTMQSKTSTETDPKDLTRMRMNDRRVRHLQRAIPCQGSVCL